MALYLGSHRIAGGGSGSGSNISVETIVKTGTNIANISVDNIPYQLYAPSSTPLPGNLVYTDTDQTISGKKTFTGDMAANKITANNTAQPTSLEGTSLIMSDGSKSYNVNYSTVKNDINGVVDSMYEQILDKIEEVKVQTGIANCLDYSARIEANKVKHISTDSCPYDCKLLIANSSIKSANLEIDNNPIDIQTLGLSANSNNIAFDIPAGVSLNASYVGTSTTAGITCTVIPYRYGIKNIEQDGLQTEELSSSFSMLTTFFEGGLKWYYYADDAIAVNAGTQASSSTGIQPHYLLYGKALKNIIVKVTEPFSYPSFLHAGQLTSYVTGSPKYMVSATAISSQTAALSNIKTTYRYNSTITIKANNYFYLRISNGRYTDADGYTRQTNRRIVDFSGQIATSEVSFDILQA